MTEDLNIFFQDFGVSCTFGGATDLVLIDYATDEMALADGGPVRDGVTMTFKTAAFPGLQTGSVIAVSGKSRKVRNVRLDGDGALSKAELL